MAAHIVRAVRRSRKRVELGAPAVFYFSLVSKLPVELIRWKRSADHLVLAGDVAVFLPTREIARNVEERLRVFESGKKRVVSRADTLGGEPVFKGTRVSVRHVGELVKRGVPLGALREDFPRLADDDFEFARIFVDLGRPPGTPRKLKLARQ